ncbi:MAG: transposase, partial [bacterium]|nr:transposase [bacterium]
MAVRNIADIFYENTDRLYLWAKDRSIPADNNLAERDLRPTVIARKVSFGSQSDNGAHTRQVLTTIFHTLKKQTKDPVLVFKSALDQLAFNSNLDTYKLLFSNKNSPADTS